VAAAAFKIISGPSRASAGPDGTVWDTTYRDYSGRPTVAVTAVVRDFASGSAPGAHPDFGRSADGGPGRYIHIPAETLGPDGKPPLRSTGHRVTRDGHDAAGNPLPPSRPYIQARPGDTPVEALDDAGGAVTSSATFAQWFRDIPGVNSTASHALT